MSARIMYGKTPWGAWFLRLLELYNGDGRLSRGKTYANSGRVFELEQDGGKVSAKVEGNYQPFYRVSLVFPQISAAEQKKIAEFTRNNPLVQAALGRGEFPPELIEFITANSIRLIPEHFSGLKRTCSCPDYGDPCKHQAAVLYLLAKEVDHNPQFLRCLAGLSEMFGQNRTESKDDGIKSAAFSAQSFKPPPPVFPRGEQPVANIPDSLSESTAVFKSNTEDSSPICADTPANYVNFILKLLPPHASFTGESFSGTLAQFYHHVIAECASLSGFSESETDVSDRQIAQARYSIDFSSGAPFEFLLGNGCLPIVRRRYQNAEQTFALPAAAKLLTQCPEHGGSLSFRLLRRIFQAGFTLLRSSAFIPAVYEYKNELRIFWKVFTAAGEIDALVKKTAAEIAYMVEGISAERILFTGQQDDEELKPVFQNDLYVVELILCAFLTAYVHNTEFRAKEPYSGMFFSGDFADTSLPGERSLAEGVANWLSVLQQGKGAFQYRFEVHLETNERVSVSIQISDDSLTAAFKPLCEVVKDICLNDNEPLRIVSLLAFPQALSAYIPKIALLAEKERVSIESDELLPFLNEATLILKSFGAEIVLPRELRNSIAPKLVIRATAKNPGASNTVSWFNINELLQCDRAVMLGDAVITIAEFEKLAAQNKPLVRFKNQYVLLDAAQIQSLLRQARRAEQVSTAEAIQSWLVSEALFSQDADKIAEKLFSSKETDLPSGLNATLRPYQEIGFRWLYGNLKSGFGCLLADDMGLGKTIQVIALLLRLKNDGALADGALIAAPATLVVNWAREISRFGPELSVQTYQGTKRSLSPRADVTLTTYQTLSRDVRKLAEKQFSLFVMDEAQAIKNAVSKSAQATRAVHAELKIALTGTPVENRLEDVRSIFDVLIPGYLGGAETFKQKWRIPIELHGNKLVAAEFRKITAPFLLRRMKTDKSIINDLPEKIITNQYVSLSPEQVALYETVVQNQMQGVLSAEEPITRGGMIFKLFTALKQVCNHPRLYDGMSDTSAELSGKCQLLVTLLAEILARGEKVLVFSQYVETLLLLQNVIKKELNEDVLMLTGKTPQIKRSAAVDTFQNDSSQSIFLISLKAGGTGLNLTAASHVVHFDLWYNPAVEDQATDRAFRIGQKNNVCVHRFISTGTFEEKIDAMIQGKRGVASMSVSSGETWLSKLTNDELRELFAQS